MESRLFSIKQREFPQSFLFQLQDLTMGNGEQWAYDKSK